MTAALAADRRRCHRFSAQAADAQTSNSPDGPSAAPRGRGRELGHAGGQLRPDAAGGAQKTGGKLNQIVYWSRPPRLAQPDADAEPRRDLSDGVLQHQGCRTDRDGNSAGGRRRLAQPATSDDIWQMALEDAGPSGADKGKGGKYLMLPPGYDRHRARRDTSALGHAHLRRLRAAALESLRSHARRRCREGGRLRQASSGSIRCRRLANPPPTTFTDVGGRCSFNSTIPLRRAASSSRSTASSRTSRGSSRDTAMIDPLRSLGIEKGKPFNAGRQDQRRRSRRASARRRRGSKPGTTTVSPPILRGQHAGWCPATPELMEADRTVDFADPDKYPVDARGAHLFDTPISASSVSVPASSI